MSIIDEYAHKRRKKKLEEVNKALERLKREHPFDPSSLKPSMQQSNTYSGKPSGTGSLFWIVVIPLIVIILALGGFLFYYMGQANTMELDYEEQKEKLETLQASLGNKTAALEEKESELKTKEELELNLSDETEQLKREKILLEEEITNLKREILDKQAELLSLNNTVENQKDEISDWMACIEDVFSEDPDDCDI